MPVLTAARLEQLPWATHSIGGDRPPERQPRGSRLCDLCGSRYLGDDLCEGGVACPRHYGYHRRRYLEWHDGCWVPRHFVERWEAEDAQGHDGGRGGGPRQVSLCPGDDGSDDSVDEAWWRAEAADHPRHAGHGTHVMPPTGETSDEEPAPTSSSAFPARSGAGPPPGVRAWTPPGAADFAAVFKAPPSVQEMAAYRDRAQGPGNSLGRPAPKPPPALVRGPPCAQWSRAAAEVRGDAFLAKPRPRMPPPTQQAGVSAPPAPTRISAVSQAGVRDGNSAERGSSGGQDEGPRLLWEVQQKLASVAQSISGHRASLQDVEARLGDHGDSCSELAWLREVVQIQSSLVESIVGQEARLQDAEARLAVLGGALASPGPCPAAQEERPGSSFGSADLVAHEEWMRRQGLRMSGGRGGGVAGEDDEAEIAAARVQAAGPRGQPRGSDDSGGGDVEESAGSKGDDRDKERGRGGEQAPGVPAQR